MNRLLLSTVLTSVCLLVGSFSSGAPPAQQVYQTYDSRCNEATRMYIDAKRNIRSDKKSADQDKKSTLKESQSKAESLTEKMNSIEEKLNDKKSDVLDKLAENERSSAEKLQKIAESSEKKTETLQETIEKMHDDMMKNRSEMRMAELKMQQSIKSQTSLYKMLAQSVKTDGFKCGSEARKVLNSYLYGDDKKSKGGTIKSSGASASFSLQGSAQKLYQEEFQACLEKLQLAREQAMDEAQSKITQLEESMKMAAEKDQKLNEKIQSLKQKLAEEPAKMAKQQQEEQMLASKKQQMLLAKMQDYVTQAQKSEARINQQLMQSQMSLMMTTLGDLFGGEGSDNQDEVYKEELELAESARKKYCNLQDRPTTESNEGAADQKKE